MGSKCVNLKCTEEVKNGWAFCSICGQDNRPPNLRASVVDCDHQIERGEFCVLCGDSTIDIHEPDNPDANWAEWIGWACLLGGVVLLIVSKIQWQQALSLGKDAPEYKRLMSDAYGFGRIAFYLIPAGAIFVVFLGKRWKIFRR